MHTKSELLLEYAARVREIPKAELQVIVPGGMLVGRPGYVRAHFHTQFQALPAGSFDDLLETGRETTAYLALEDARYVSADDSRHLGSILVDPDLVSAWGRHGQT